MLCWVKKKIKKVIIFKKWFEISSLNVLVQFVHGSRLANARVDESVTKLSDSGFKIALRCSHSKISSTAERRYNWGRRLAEGRVGGGGGRL